MRRLGDIASVPVTLAACAAASVVALTSKLGTDYPTDGGPPIDALVRGDIGGALALQPQMGQLSLIARWPAAALADALGGGDLWVYRAGALVCLLVAAALAVVLAHGPRPRDGERRRGETDGPLLAIVTIAVLVANPVVLRALDFGHPEEPMCAALCVGAVLLALGRRPTAAGIALGLALATKQWALFAILPALLACADRRAVIALVRVGLPIAAVWTALPFLLDPHAFVAALEKPATGLHEIRPGNVWSLVLGTSATVDLGGGATADVTFVPGWLRATAHPAIIVLAIAVPLLWARRRRADAARRATDVLAVLALAMLVRCVLDPWNHEYYHLPFLMALAAWEVRACRRAPVLTAISSAVLWLVFARLAQGSGHSSAADLLYAGWALAALAGLVRVLWWPRAVPAQRGVVAAVS